MRKGFVYTLIAALLVTSTPGLYEMASASELKPTIAAEPIALSDEEMAEITGEIAWVPLLVLGMFLVAYFGSIYMVGQSCNKSYTNSTNSTVIKSGHTACDNARYYYDSIHNP